MTNHEAERECADDRNGDRKSRQFNISDVADEHGGDGVSPELTENLERNGTPYYPQLRRFYAENPPPVLHPFRRKVVAVIANQLAGAPPLEQRRLHLKRPKTKAKRRMDD